MTILVTGATGYVGRRVVRQLVEAGEPVRALTRSPAAASALLPAGSEVVPGDLADPPAWGDVAGWTAEAVTGRPARTFGQWARDHAADFR